MGYYVHVHVAFACTYNESIAKLAFEHRAKLPPSEQLNCHEAEWFLESLAARTGMNPGPKGGLSLWGMIGNYTNGERFVDALKPFWTDLLRHEDGPCDHAHILVFVETEQSEQTAAYEISLQHPRDKKSTDLVIKFHRCPFTFMQY